MERGLVAIDHWETTVLASSACCTRIPSEAISHARQRYVYGDRFEIRAHQTTGIVRMKSREAFVSTQRNGCALRARRRAHSSSCSTRHVFEIGPRAFTQGGLCERKRN